MEQAKNVPLDAAVGRTVEVRVKTEPEIAPEENTSLANGTTGVNVGKAKKQTRPRQAQCPKTLPRPIVSSNTIELRAMFKTRPEFLQVLDNFSNRTYQAFTKVSSKFNTDLGTGLLIPGFEYKAEVYKCVYGGKPRKRGTGQRPNQTYLALGCRALIRVNLDSKLKALVITTCKLKHNHPLTPDVLDKEERKKFAKTFLQTQERAASEASSSFGTSSLSEAGSSSASGGSSGASSSSETSSSGSSSQLSMTALQNCIDNVVNNRLTPIQNLMLQAYPNLNLATLLIIQLLAAAANPSPAAINPSVPAITVQPEPVDSEQPRAVNTLASEGTTSVTPLTNIETEPSSSVQNAGNTDNQENEQTGYDHLDQFVEEIENYAPVNDLKAMQEIVNTLRSIRNGIPH